MGVVLQPAAKRVKRAPARRVRRDPWNDHRRSDLFNFNSKLQLALWRVAPWRPGWGGAQPSTGGVGWTGAVTLAVAADFADPRRRAVLFNFNSKLQLAAWRKAEPALTSTSGLAPARGLL
jgi:hypothetical protein